MYKSPLERKLARHKVRRWTKALEVFLEGLITFMVLSAFAIWAWTVHLLALA
jgi:hypothetical protein